ncbi:protein toll-like [Argopecten irradians]|uniref:protein toll-like n=1 Tax=Argopecten irradians TaxID=31199 RepID=UPI00370FCC10
MDLQSETELRLLVLALVIAIMAATGPCDFGYSVCTIENSTLPQICCMEHCCNVESKCHDQRNLRCVCNTQRLVKDNLLHPLDVEYTTVGGSSLIIGRNDIKSILKHSHGYMGAFPNNLCHYQLLVKTDLRQNEIQEITNISCLINLDTLDLSWNQISYISNSTFQGLVSLRDLNLAHNRIRYIEPYSFSHQTSSILNIQLEDNAMTEVDVTNVIINRPFCDLDYANNKIENIVNDVGWTLTADDTIVDGGFVDLTENNLSGIIDFLSLGVADLTVLGKIMSYGIDIHDIPLQCTCEMEPFLEMAESSIKALWRDYFNMSCGSPEHLKGQPVPDLVLNNKLDLFICNISQTDGCPYDCNCYKQPSKDRVVVNCSGHGLIKMPPQAPTTDLKLEIFLDNNSIRNFEWRRYLNHTRKIVLSENPIDSVSGRALRELQRNETQVDFRGHRIHNLPRDILYLKPNLFNFGELTILCSCDNTWFGEWLTMHEKEKGDQNQFWCHTTSGKEAPEVVTRQFLDCDEPSMLPKWITIALALLTSLIIGISLIVKLFKYEIYLVFRTFRNKQKKYPDMDYDVYISYDDTDAEVNKWVMNTLLPSLERDGYHVCIPARDFNVGVPYEEDITHFMGRSKFVVVVLSKNETCVFWDMEWKQVWFSYTSYTIKDIILVNFDMFEYDSVSHPVLRAFVRLGKYFDFANMDKALIMNIKKKLGCSGKKSRQIKNEFSNCRTQFNRLEMLMKR